MIKTAIIALISVSLLSCGEELEEKDGSLGKASSPSGVNEALTRALDGISTGYARVGDYVDYVYNIRIELGGLLLQKEYQQSLESIQLNDAQTEVTFTFNQVETLYDLGSGNSDGPVQRELDVTFQLTADEPTKLNSLSPNKMFALKSTVNTCDGVEETDNEGHTYDCIKYYNLTYKEGLAEPPAAVKNRPNCMGLTNCLIRVRSVEFDQVKWTKGRSVDTVTFSALISPDVPDIMYYNSGSGRIAWEYPVLNYCTRGYHKLEDRNAIVRFCHYLRDFRYGPK